MKIFFTFSENRKTKQAKKTQHENLNQKLYPENSKSDIAKECNKACGEQENRRGGLGDRDRKSALTGVFISHSLSGGK